MDELLKILKQFCKEIEDVASGYLKIKGFEKQRDFAVKISQIKKDFSRLKVCI